MKADGRRFPRGWRPPRPTNHELTQGSRGIILQRRLETRVVNFVVNFENKRFGEILLQKGARKSIGLARYSLQTSTKPYLCRQVLFGSFSDMPLNFSCQTLFREDQNCGDQKTSDFLFGFSWSEWGNKYFLF